MVEHGRTEPLLALAFDGLGFGPDGTLWGGELLVADLSGYERIGHLAIVPMPGGASAIREPWRMAAVWLSAAAGRPAVAAALPDVEPDRREAVLDLAESGLSPRTSSMGRLFDAVAVLLGGRRRVSYEAQAAIELEALARTVERSAVRASATDVEVTEADGRFVLDPGPLLRWLVAERARGVAPAVLAAGFHEAIGRASAALAARLATERGLDTVAVTGGVFQNVRLTEVVEDALTEAGLAVLVHENLPPNDGAISVGQAAIACWPGRP
jgi:hydrogenase maturation protein HypF